MYIYIYIISQAYMPAWFSRLSYHNCIYACVALEGLNIPHYPSIAGDPNAGKTTLINLLLDEDLLPTADQGQTSVICEIRYGTPRRMVICPWEGEQKFVPLVSKSQLANYICGKDPNEEEEFPYKKVTIYMDAPLLKVWLLFL